MQQRYVGTAFADKSNAVAGIGGDGQCVVYAGGATIIWMQTDRLYTPNSNEGLRALLGTIFEIRA